MYQQKKEKIVFVRLELTTFTLQHDALPKTMLNSFYLVFIVLIIDSQQVSIFMKQPRSIHNCLWRAKRKSCPCEVKTHDLDVISMFAISIQKKEEVVFNCEARTHDLHIMLYHTETAPMPCGAKSKQTFNITQTNILRTRLCGACSG